jgi:hypothetical protein
MKAISLWQPWATAIVLGLKTVETRGWSTKYRGPIAIHAAKTKAGREMNFSIDTWWEENLHAGDYKIFKAAGYDTWQQLPFGAVVAVARLSDARRVEELSPGKIEARWGDYAPSRGRFCWELDNIIPLKIPIPARGRQRLWEWDATGLLESLAMATEIDFPVIRA